MKKKARLGKDQKTLTRIFEVFAADNPNPKSELTYNNHFSLLIAILLSAQATDVSVNKATPALFSIADTPEKMLDLGEENLKNYIKNIGLYNSKARHIIALSEKLIAEYNSEVPKDFLELQKLPGVGSKTAAVFLNSAFDFPLIGVDTHVHRISNLIGIVRSDSAKQTERFLNQMIEEKWKKHLNHWFVLHGRYICKARKPACHKCQIKNYCNFYQSKLELKKK